MLKIKFSNKYNKMLGECNDEPPQVAILIEVFKVRTKDLHPRFIEYDTSYFDEKEKKLCYYKLPKGEVIVLLLRSDDFMWTTIRRFTPQKYDYYKRNRWETFEIVIGGDNGR